MGKEGVYEPVMKLEGNLTTWVLPSPLGISQSPPYVGCAKVKANKAGGSVNSASLTLLACAFTHLKEQQPDHY